MGKKKSMTVYDRVDRCIYFEIDEDPDSLTIPELRALIEWVRVARKSLAEKERRSGRKTPKLGVWATTVDDILRRTRRVLEAAASP